MSISSLKKLAAVKLSLMEIKPIIIKKCLPPEVYEYYLAIKKYYFKCHYCEKYYGGRYNIFYSNEYCSFGCYIFYHLRKYIFLMMIFILLYYKVYNHYVIKYILGVIAILLLYNKIYYYHIIKYLIISILMFQELAHF